jgi:hypothetical protein
MTRAKVRREAAMFTAIGGLIVALFTAWMHGCALVGNCRCVHLRSPGSKAETSGA